MPNRSHFAPHYSVHPAPYHPDVAWVQQVQQPMQYTMDHASDVYRLESDVATKDEEIKALKIDLAAAQRELANVKQENAKIVSERDKFETELGCEKRLGEFYKDQHQQLMNFWHLKFVSSGGSPSSSPAFPVGHSDSISSSPVPTIVPVPFTQDAPLGRTENMSTPKDTDHSVKLCDQKILPNFNLPDSIGVSQDKIAEDRKNHQNESNLNFLTAVQSEKVRKDGEVGRTQHKARECLDKMLKFMEEKTTIKTHQLVITNNMIEDYEKALEDPSVDEALTMRLSKHLDWPNSFSKFYEQHPDCDRFINGAYGCDPFKFENQVGIVGFVSFCQAFRFKLAKNLAWGDPKNPVWANVLTYALFPEDGCPRPLTLGNFLH